MKFGKVGLNNHVNLCHRNILQCVHQWICFVCRSTWVSLSLTLYFTCARLVNPTQIERELFPCKYGGTRMTLKCKTSPVFFFDTMLEVTMISHINQYLIDTRSEKLIVLIIKRVVWTATPREGILKRGGWKRVMSRILQRTSTPMHFVVEPSLFIEGLFKCTWPVFQDIFQDYCPLPLS